MKLYSDEELAELLDQDIFHIIGDAADHLGVECYVVGGYVRDLFLERPSDDIDVVVVGSGIEVAKELKRRLGHRAHLSVFKNFGTAQVKIKTGEEEIEVEFVGARRESYSHDSRKPVVENGTLEDDQNRRDFTINAMAICLNRARFGELVDPFNGLADLEDGIIATPLDPAITFSDDPLRMMRCIRFATQLNFQIEDETFEGLERMADRIRIVSGERIMVELNKIILSPHPSKGFVDLQRAGLLNIILPELSALDIVEQRDGRAHKNNFYHTLEVLENVVRMNNEKLEMRNDNEQCLNEAAQPISSFDHLNSSFLISHSSLYLRWAALLHDIGKTKTKRWEPGTGWTFHNHNYIGARMVAPIFRRLKLPMGAEMKYVEKLVELHMRPQVIADEEVTDSAVRRLLNDAGDDIDDLMTLCEADITSKNEVKKRFFLENFRMVREKLTDLKEKDYKRLLQPCIDGNEIMELFHLKPSREVGTLKQYLKDAVLDNRVENEREPLMQLLLEKARKMGLLVALCLFATLSCFAWERETVWPKGKMPDAQSHQIAAMTDEAGKKDFKADKHRVAYLEWFDAPADSVKVGGCMILISGGSYQSCCDVGLIKQWRERFTALGFQCVNFVYRTPRPVGLPIYQTAWEDGQRAVRMVRSEAKKRGYDPEKIGVISMSAGSHLALLLATSSQTPAYTPVDKLDSVPCHINWAVVNAPAYVTTDGEAGTPATLQGYGKDVRLSDLFKFDAKTCPMSLHHGGKDIYSPNGSTLVYRELRKRKIPAEVHIYPNIGHRALGLERAVEFMRQMGYVEPLAPEVRLMDRYASDEARRELTKENVWPEGTMPNRQPNQCEPYIEWHFPKELKTKAIQIIYSGGNYNGSKPDSFEVAPARRYLNERGMTVVTLKYRVPRPPKESGLAKHTTAWQDLQRTIRIVRSKADSLGLDPKQIGIMGSSAGGHLTMMGVTSSLHQSYLPIDDIDKQPCNVQWGIAIYPAYGLTDGAEKGNTTGGNDDSAVLVPEFSFDLKTAPMLFIHGDADGWAAMNSVKAWEKLRAMGIQSELHTLATRPHCFQRTASPGTGSYTWLDRIGDFLKEQIRILL